MPMEELYVFGTGNAQATRCYNTCFAIKDGDEYFMVDAGGGNGILRILEDMDAVSYTHLDVYKRQNQGSCQGLCDRRFAGQCPIPAFVQGFPAGVNAHRHHIFIEKHPQRIAGSIFREPGDSLSLIHI